MRKLSKEDYQEVGYTCHRNQYSKIESYAKKYTEGTDADHDDFVYDWLVEFYIYADQHFTENAKLVDVWKNWKKDVRSTQTDTWRDSWRDKNILSNFQYFFNFINFCQTTEEDEKIWAKKKDFIDKAQITAWSKESAKEFQEEKKKIMPAYRYWD